MKKLITYSIGLFTLLLVNISIAQSSSDFVGKYKMDANDYVSELTISNDNGQLMIQAEGYDSAPITTTEKADSYYLSAMDLDIRFTRDDQGKVSGIVLEGQGGQLTGKLQAASLDSQAGNLAGGSSDTPNLNEYAGTYNLEPNDYVEKFTFELNDKGQLTIVAEGQEPGILSPDKDADKFYTNLAGYDADITFNRLNGKVVSIEMSVGGGAVVFKGSKEIAEEADQEAGSALDKYAGVYNMDPNGYIEKLNFEVVDGALTLVMDGQEPGVLNLDDSKENFFTTNLAGYDCEITFSGEGDEISKIEMVVGGGMAVFTGKK